MIYTTGTIAISGNTLTGTGTNFTAANPAIPAGTKYSILLSDSLSVDGLAQDIAETFTMYQRYMSGFADVMNGTTDVTITINGVAVTVPGQKSLAKKGANDDITSLSGLTTALSISQGGTGAKNASDARANLGAAKSGDNE
ncbi:MAG: phage tail protein, partial [Enterobacter sp.]|nr:phage tail protein [Enterobacter sp.]